MQIIIFKKFILLNFDKVRSCKNLRLEKYKTRFFQFKKRIKQSNKKFIFDFEKILLIKKYKIKLKFIKKLLTYFIVFTYLHYIFSTPNKS